MVIHITSQLNRFALTRFDALCAPFIEALRVRASHDDSS